MSQSDPNSSSPVAGRVKCGWCDNWSGIEYPSDPSYSILAKMPITNGEYFVVIQECSGHPSHLNLMYWSKPKESPWNEKTPPPEVRTKESPEENNGEALNQEKQTAVYVP